MALLFKPGSQPHASWAMAAALIAVERIFLMRGAPLVITAGIDGTHMEGSKHYEGLAFDCRIKHVAGEEHTKIIEEIKRALGVAYDVLLEGAGTDNAHIHIEWDAP